MLNGNQVMDSRIPMHQCNACRLPIESDIIEIPEGFFHAACFICHQCLEPFINNQFFIHQKKPYCQSDYILHAGQRCARCADFITSQHVNALDMYWHYDHFTCETCGCPLANTNYQQVDNKAYCRPCFVKGKQETVEGEQCGRCRKLLIGTEIISIKNINYHMHHFNCAGCRCVLSEGWREYQGKFWCKSDYEKMVYGSGQCLACKENIFGRAVAALGKMFHPEHFVCCVCAKVFADDLFFEHEGKAYCEQHYNEATGDLCIVCFAYIQGKVKLVQGKAYCGLHFRCCACFRVQSDQVKMTTVDGKLICFTCWEELPSSVRKSAEKYKSDEKKR